MIVVYLIFGGFFVAALLGVFYLITRFHQFRRLQKLSENHRVLSWFIALIPIAVLIGGCVYNLVNGVIVIIHFMVFWIFADLIGMIVRKVLHKPSVRRKKRKINGIEYDDWEADAVFEPVTYWEGLAAILITILYLGMGLYENYHVRVTEYQLETRKNIGADSIRIVQIADSHLGTTFGGEGFAEHMKTVQEQKPDLVVITGDYVDDGTRRSDMVTACEALGKLDTTYGVFYVSGNHDGGYFGSRDFSYEELKSELKKNDVTVLEDETVKIADHINIVGRKDRSDPYRLSMEELISDLSTSDYMIVLDHQPHDFAAQREANADLVLCGHTHGGQMFPVGILGELSGANEKTYGLASRGSTNYIVTSGISDWEILFKTFTFSEIVVIDIEAQ